MYSSMSVWEQPLLKKLLSELPKIFGRAGLKMGKID